ncbi:hypothetical protein ACTWJ8_39920 (plasmid) [Streptomyces sp. SDT5-1]|uniref:hypothetical protein n=1 Tax=Streptomyces sp. SDT5-1 TaxID=3406418 RepID=UPI003FD30468
MSRENFPFLPFTRDVSDSLEVALPSRPTPIRVQSPGMPPRDVTLHPDGTLTAVLGGRMHRNLLTFAEMREQDWRDAHIELAPAPSPEDPAPAATRAEPVQDALL